VKDGDNFYTAKGGKCANLLFMEGGRKRERKIAWKKRYVFTAYIPTY
jgi:hypothetical protein